MKHDVLNSPRLQELKKHRRKSLQNKIILFFVGILVLLVGFGFLSRISKLNIKTISISGNIVVDTEDIEIAVRNNMSGHYLWLYPKTNVFFYPKNKIKENLEQEFKRLKDISLNVTNIETLEISVAEREGVYIWCGVAIPNPTDEQCSFLDKDGYIFDESPYFSGEVYFKFYGEIFQEYNPKFSELVMLKKNLESMGLKPVGLFVDRDGNARMLLSLENTQGKNPEIIFKVDADLEKLAENLQAALDTDPLKTDIKKKYSALEYIDLRYGNKVYYRFK